MKQKGQTFSGSILSYVRICCFLLPTPLYIECLRFLTYGKSHLKASCWSCCTPRTCAGQSSLLHSKNHCVNTLTVKCLHRGPQSYTVGQQWDVLPVKIAPVATSKSAICHSFCPHYKQRTSQAQINIVTDLGNNSMPDISKQVAEAVVVGVTFAHQSPRHYEWGGEAYVPYVINPGRRLLSTSLHGWACGWLILLCTRSLVFLGCAVKLPAEQHLTTQKAAPMDRK